MTHHVQVIAADGEMRASLALAEASGVIHNSPAAIKLRHLQVFTYDVDLTSDIFLIQTIYTSSIISIYCVYIYRP